MNQVAIWIRTIGMRAAWPAGTLIILTGLAAHFGWLEGAAVWWSAGLVFVLVNLIPLAEIFALAPGETFIERRARLRRRHDHRHA
jgi:hypothetical protein